MRCFYLVFLFAISFIPNILFCQKQVNLESRIQHLEKSLDSLKLQLRFHRQFYDHTEIELSKIRSRLALEINRNFTFFAYFYEAEPDNKDGKGYQRIFCFNGYQSVQKHNQAIESNQADYIKTIRQNLNSIKKIVVGSNTNPQKYSEDYTLYPNRLILNYYDNSTGDEPIIVADTDLNSLKVRINGVLREVGWE